MSGNQAESEAVDRAIANRDGIEQTQAISPEQNVVGEQNTTQSKAYNAFTLKRWRIDTTIDRVQICIWILILIMKVVSMLSVISFWISLFFWLKSLPGWEGPQRIFNGFARRRAAGINNQVIPADDSLWDDLFPVAEALLSYQLNFTVEDSAIQPNLNLYGFRVPLLTANPVMWLLFMGIIFCCYNIASIVYGSLLQASTVMRNFARRQYMYSND